MIDTLLCRSISSYKLPVSCQVVNGAQEAPENCTGKNPVQSCLDTQYSAGKNLKQYCTRKNPVQCCHNTTLGTTLHR